MRMKHKTLLFWMFLGMAGTLAAAEPSPEVAQVQFNLNVVWTILGGILVFAMQAGFAMVETGLTRAKNAANIMMKNLMDFALGSLAFFLVGAAFMFGKTAWGVIGTDGWFMTSLHGAADWDWTFFFFQTMFAATSATIVSGAVAERTKFSAYLIYSVIVSAFIYPISGKWAWGALYNDAAAGWLGNLGFCDFAGSNVVHSVGGWLALAGAITLGPRLGKYNPDGRPNMIPGHNLVIATLGVLILWIGWFGFNPASTTAGIGDIGRIALVTNFGAVAGMTAAMITAWLVMKKPDLSMTLNGALAGLVAITAPCNTVTPVAAIVIGTIAGVLVVFSVFAIDRLGIDDPVGASSVHGVCGILGTLLTGLLSTTNGTLYGHGWGFFGAQCFGILVIDLWAAACGFALFYGIKKLHGLRVPARIEDEGLDIYEHGETCYN